jgi:hypothetical protein
VFEVALNKTSLEEDLMQKIDELDIAPEFRKYPAEQLCTISMGVVAVRLPD